MTVIDLQIVTHRAQLTAMKCLENASTMACSLVTKFSSKDSVEEIPLPEFLFAFWRAFGFISELVSADLLHRGSSS